EGTRGDGADARELRELQGREIVEGLGAADQGEAARLVGVGGDLREIARMREPDRDGDAEVALDLLLEPREEMGGRRAMEAGGAGEIEEGLVEGERLDKRREPFEPLADPARDGDVLGEVRGDDDGVWTELA